MAYIIGLLSEAEEMELRRRGWEVEVPDRAVADYLCPDRGADAMVRMVWVDANMFDVMSGPDWDSGKVTS